VLTAAELAAAMRVSASVKPWPPTKEITMQDLALTKAEIAWLRRKQPFGRSRIRRRARS
jgi:hypothetical protein